MTLPDAPTDPSATQGVTPVTRRRADIGQPGSRRAEAAYVALAALVGLLAGAVGSAFHRVIDMLAAWPDMLRRVMDGPAFPAACGLMTMLVTVGVVALVRRIAPEAAGSGVQEIEGAMEGLRTVRGARVLPVKFLGGAAAIGSGLVLGREGPTIHIGAALAALLSRSPRLHETERRGLLAAGAAAGLACAFNAPIAAILFVIEETHRQFPYTYRTYMGVIAAAFCATVVTEVIGGTAPDLTVIVPTAPLATLPLFLLMGCILGAVGVLLNAAILSAVRFAAAAQARVPYAYPACVGLAVGVLLASVPQAVTGGEGLIVDILHRQPAIGVLLALALARFCTTVASYSTGVPGGIFAPILALAVCIGLAFGAAVSFFWPQPDALPAAFAIAAMGGLFTASVRAPVVGVVLTLELTGSYALALPLIATCLAANLAARALGGRPIYEELLDRTLAMAGIVPRKPAADRDTGLA